MYTNGTVVKKHSLYDVWYIIFLKLMWKIVHFELKIGKTFCKKMGVQNTQAAPPQWNTPLHGKGAYLTTRFQASASTRRARWSDAATFD